jgi:uncharacterized membrane protein
VAHRLEVEAPIEKVYEWWRSLRDLSFVTSGLHAVAAGPRDRATQQVGLAPGPLGGTPGREARIVEDIPNQRIAWAGTGGGGAVATCASVRFDDNGATTGVEMTLTCDPPAGAVGQQVRRLLANLDKVERAVRACKEQIEARSPPGPGTNADQRGLVVNTSGTRPAWEPWLTTWKSTRRPRRPTAGGAA